MERSLRIVVADDEEIMRKYYAEILPVIGHQVIAMAQTGRELLEQCRTLRPDLVITDIKMPDMDGIEAARRICAERGAPVILVSGFHEPGLVERAAESHVMAYLVKPIKRENIEPAIAIAVQRFKQFQSVQQEAANLERALKDRKLIDRAKGIIMKEAGVDEDAAFRRMQKLARDKNVKLADIAEIILAAHEVMRENSKG